MFERATGEIIDKKENNKSINILTTISFAFVGCTLILAGVLIEGGLFSIFVGIWLLIFNVFFTSRSFAKFEFRKEGIIAKYPFSTPRLIAWNKFQQICICYASYNKLGGAFVVIACVKHGEKKNLYGRWKTDSIFRHRKVITLDYTDELYKEIKEKCPYEIMDLRMTRSYKLR